MVGFSPCPRGNGRKQQLERHSLAQPPRIIVPTHGCSDSCDDARTNSTPLTTSTELPETADFWWPRSSLRSVVSENCVRRQRSAGLDNRLVKSCGDLPAHRPTDDHFLLPDFPQSCSTNDVSDLSDWTFCSESSSATAQSRDWWMNLEDFKPWEWSVSSASTSDLTIRTWSSTEYTTAIDSLGSSASTIIPSSFFSMPTTDCELSELADEFDYDSDDDADFEEEEESDYSLSSTVKTSSSVLELRECAMKARNYENFKQLATGSLAGKSPSEVLDALFHDYRELVLQRQWKWCGTDEFDSDEEGTDWEVATSDEEEAADEWDGDDSRSVTDWWP